MAKKHELREILSHEAITKAVNTIWDKGIFVKDWNFMLLRPFNVPKILFYVNVLLDFLFFMLLSLMMLTGMCVKARAQRIEIFKNYFFIKIAAKSMSVTDGWDSLCCWLVWHVNDRSDLICHQHFQTVTMINFIR